MSFVTLSSMHPALSEELTLAKYIRKLTGKNVLIRTDGTTGLLVDTVDSTNDLVKPKGLIVAGSVMDYLDLTALVNGPMPWAVVEVLCAKNPTNVKFLEVSYENADDALAHIEAINEKNVVGLARKVGISFPEVEQHVNHFKANIAYHVVVEPSDREHVTCYGIYHSMLNTQIGVIIHNSKYAHRNAIILSGYNPRTLTEAITYLK